MTLQQNGIAEKKNKTLMEMVKFMIAQTNLSISFWGDCFLIATYIFNHVPTKAIFSTPYKLWIGKEPNLSYLKPWGFAIYDHNLSHRHGKLGLMGKKCIFIRYSEHSKGYEL